MAYTLPLGIGEGKGGERRKREGGVAFPVLDGDTKRETEERYTVRQGELQMVLWWIPMQHELHFSTSVSMLVYLPVHQLV